MIADENNYLTSDNQLLEYNPFKITNTKGIIKAGVLIGKMPGENRLDQFNILSKALNIPEKNDLISNSFHNGNSWLIINFENMKDFIDCTLTLGNNLPKIDLILLSNEKKNLSKQMY